MISSKARNDVKAITFQLHVYNIHECIAEGISFNSK